MTDPNTSDSRVTVASLKDVTVTHGTTFTLGPVSFELAPGVTGLLGPNGAGKSTLIRTIAGLQRPSSGTVAFVDRSGSVGYLAQQFEAPRRASLSDYLSYVAWAYGVSRGDRDRAVHEALCAVDLEGRAKDRIGTLSGGMFRRLGIAQAIIDSPHLVLLDEPTAGLDFDQRLQLISMIKSIAATTAVLVSTHVLDDIARLAERIVVLDAGRVTFDGPISQVPFPAGLATEFDQVGSPSPETLRGLEALVRRRASDKERR